MTTLLKHSVHEILDGNVVDEYPVDESQTVSNAGNATVYEVDGIRYEAIEWNMHAMEHEPGQVTVTMLEDDGE